MCEVYILHVEKKKDLCMYSKEFMKFLYNYQKENFKPKENTVTEIRFTNRGSGKRAEIFVEVKK